MEVYSRLQNQNDIEAMESNGILLNLNQKGRSVDSHTDIVQPYMILTLNLAGTSHCLYDMKEIRAKKNDLTVFLPGHIIRPLDHSEDYTQAWLLFNPAQFANSERQFNPKDLETLYNAPLCHLTDEQAEQLMAILQMINYIMTRKEEDLPNKHKLLEMQLTVAYDLYLAIRRKQDQEWEKDRIGHVYLEFCDLVAAHYKEERNVNFYARLLGYDPRYFTKVFRSYNNGTAPLEWIQNYISTRAKHIMDENPKQSIKVTAFQLGFPTTANFCRYFHRATGMNPKEYKQKSAQH